MSEQQSLRLFGAAEAVVRERLADVMSCDDVSVALEHDGSDVHIRFCAQTAERLDWAVEAVRQRLGSFLYSEDGSTLEAQTVRLLTEKHKTVAIAESCTGGLVASKLTDVSGCSAVFGTGVVSYSWDCKKKMLGVSPQTLDTYGAVSAQTAREMADGIRRQSGADIGIATTGEAGPNAAEDKPVGTVFVALADAKRTWVKELHLDGEGMDRSAIRAAAAKEALHLTLRYLQAYPTVIAGGERLTDLYDRKKESAPSSSIGGRLTAVLPWHGNRKSRWVKGIAWMLVFAVLVLGVLLVYNHILTPSTNRELQDNLAQMYWDSDADLTSDVPSDKHYPSGMMSQFRGLYDMNSDVAGWVRIPDTSINYPITNYADGYYNNHNFNDQFSVYGQPYFYEGTEPTAAGGGHVLTVYGNNTRDEQMFSSLVSYRRIAYLRENPIIEMNTLYANAQWEIFAVAVVDERARDSEFEYCRTSFVDEAAFDHYIDGLCRRSLFRSDGQLTMEDSVLLLVTNVEREYGFSGARLVVAARKMTQKEPSLRYALNGSVVWPSAYQRLTTTHPTTTTTTTATTTTTTTTTTMVTTTETTTETTTTTSTTTATTTAPTEPEISVDESEPPESEAVGGDLSDDESSEEEIPESDPSESISDEEEISEVEQTETNDDDYLGN